MPCRNIYEINSMTVTLLTVMKNIFFLKKLFMGDEFTVYFHEYSGFHKFGIEINPYCILKILKLQNFTCQYILQKYLWNKFHDCYILNSRTLLTLLTNTLYIFILTVPGFHKFGIENKSLLYIKNFISNLQKYL